MAEPYEIQLSFIPLVESDFSFTVFRKRLPDSEQSVPSTRYLPVGSGGNFSERARFEVSYEEEEGFESYLCHSWNSIELTTQVLYDALLRRRESDDLINVTFVPERRFFRKVDFLLESHDDGKQVVWMRPYALKVTGEFGFLVDFHFNASSPGPPNKRQLELSLAQRNGRKNADYYADKYEKIAAFRQEFAQQISEIDLHDNSRVTLSTNLKEISATRLENRTYILGNDVETNSTFQGLRSSYPFLRAPEDARLIFVFRERDRPQSQELYRALRGELFPTFPGMERMFGLRISRKNVSGVVVSDFGPSEIQRIGDELKQKFPETRVLPVAVVPFSKDQLDGDTQGYYKAKHAFLKNKLPCQFVDRAKFERRDTLKWAISNIGLAVFAKIGGIPWKVNPTTQRGLIVGIGQAHRRRNDEIQRYFAYSVLTDSSGLYEDIRVLGESTDEQAYLSAFRETLRDIIHSHRNQFDSFVIHATFRIRKSELKAIQEVLSEVSEGDENGGEFAALKFNDRNDFFGYSAESNSRVPLVGTVAKLSKHDFLVWFDGLSKDTHTLTTRPENPMHVKVLYPFDALPDATIHRYLQDAYNTAGANWRGFNARSVPISVYYAKLIADYYGRFQELELEDIELQGVTPWFL